MSAREEIKLFRRLESRAQSAGAYEALLDLSAGERLRALERENARLTDTLRRLLARYSERGAEVRRLRDVDGLRSRFLGNLSHELRSPLNSVFGLTTLLLSRSDGELSAEQARSVELIRKAADTMLELINDLGDPAKTEGGKIELCLAPCDVTELLRTLQGMLPAPLIKSGVELVFDTPAAVPPLYTDENKVAQILRNLINNALKFTGRGEVRVSAAYDPVHAATIFSVRDTGVGIRPNDQQKLRENTYRSAQGSGLGLPLCHTLAALLGGRISVESEPGAGSTFRLTLPQRFVPAGADAAPSPLPPI